MVVDAGPSNLGRERKVAVRTNQPDVPVVSMAHAAP